MSATVTTLIAAGIAVLGTLISPVLVQYTTARAKRQDDEMARQQRQEEREDRAQLEKHADLRVAYTELNAEMRSFTRALSNYLYLIVRDQCSEEARSALTEAREKYLQCYSDAQMKVSDSVLVAAAQANSGLAGVFGMALRLDGLTAQVPSSEEATPDKDGEFIDKAFDHLQEARALTWKVRDIMRRELGVSSTAYDP